MRVLDIELAGLAGLVALVTLLGLSSLSGCRADRARPLTIFTASSTLSVVEELVGGEIAVHGAASSTLARQIAAGARADLFISAHPIWLRTLAEKNCIDRDRKQIFARNSLVIATRAEGPSDLETLPRRVAIGDPAHVPLGIYAKQALISTGRWSEWRERLLPAADARGALEYLLLGEADVAILYRTDAVGRSDLRILEEIDPAHHDPIELWIVPVVGAAEGTTALLEKLTSEAARQMLLGHGFTVDPSSEPAPERAGR